MIRITFKDVGQGDSIILEWEKEQRKKIAIIDCKKAYRTNPILDYIKEKNVQEISFLLLSHPHLDHFSGFAELIEYCIHQNIKIKYFLHTANNTPAYWKAAVDGEMAASEIIKLFNLIRIAREKIGMNFHSIQSGTINPDIPLNNDIFIKLIAPTSIHLDKYAINMDESFLEEEVGNKSNGNWLSTAIKVYSNKNDNYVLLTSDSKKEVLFYDERNPNFFNGNLILAQCPHHGAEGSFKNAFWKLIKRTDKTPIVISVGDNIYGHPAEKVINDLNKNNYKIFSTNKVGALSTKLSSSGKEAIIHLSIFGEPVSKQKIDHFQGDKIFEIDFNGKVFVIE